MHAVLGKIGGGDIHPQAATLTEHPVDVPHLQRQGDSLTGRIVVVLGGDDGDGGADVVGASIGHDLYHLRSKGGVRGICRYLQGHFDPACDLPVGVQGTGQEADHILPPSRLRLDQTADGRFGVQHRLGTVAWDRILRIVNEVHHTLLGLGGQGSDIAIPFGGKGQEHLFISGQGPRVPLSPNITIDEVGVNFCFRQLFLFQG